MNTSKLFFPAIIAVITLLFYSCKKPQPAEPVDHNSDSRSYSWSVDTVRNGTTSPLLTLWGRNENYIFLAMKDGIAHYNGKNIEYIYKFSNSYITLYGLICFQNSVFILAFDSSIQSNIIIKGTAKN